MAEEKHMQTQTQVQAHTLQSIYTYTIYLWLESSTCKHEHKHKHTLQLIYTYTIYLWLERSTCKQHKHKHKCSSQSSMYTNLPPDIHSPDQFRRALYSKYSFFPSTLLSLPPFFSLPLPSSLPSLPPSLFMYLSHANHRVIREDKVFA